MKKFYFEPQCSIHTVHSISITTTSVEGNGEDFSGDDSWSNKASIRGLSRDSYENNE